MNPTLAATTKALMIALPEKLRQAFDATATWVAQLSWWKFILFAILVLMAGGIMQDTLFSSRPDVVVPDKKSSSKVIHGRSKLINEGKTDVRIDATGIHISKEKPAIALPPPIPASPATPPSSTLDVPPAKDVNPDVNPDTDEVHITLPPEVSQEVQDMIADAVDDAAAQKVETYREKSSEWFMNFVLLLVLGLFGTKALMGGKKRAEAQAAIANAAAEREAMQRQVSEARMQMMQAQVEPHFLFNTLASVEHLIETDPPRAARMQHSLILYLRAVLPQMRGNTSTTNLGREVDMVLAYLDLLKMRMEERLVIDCQVPDGLRSAAFPPMMLQSLVENAIKHGLESKANGGTLRLSAEIADNLLRVSVTDTGLGFGAVASNGTGLGLQNIRERLKLMHGAAAQLIIAPNPAGGVIATIEVPYLLAK